MSPSAWFFSGLVAMQVLNVLLPGPRWVEQPWVLLGALPIAAGMLLHARALRALRLAGTTPDPEGRSARLVRDGPYARVRNPMYLAGVPILVGCAAMLGTVTPALVLAAYVAVSGRWVASEERALAEQFGEEWERYRETVPRWL